MGLYLAVHGITAATTPTPSSPLLLQLFTTTTTAVLSEIVLLGVVATLVARSRISDFEFVAWTVAGRFAITDASWPGVLTAVVGGAIIAVLYLHFNRLTPIILGHTLAAATVTVLTTWLSTL
ncbi:hypothetical protein KGD82_16130 [Nocardiopsis eucommiae]|uniref:Uncharacterized protein n=1 Tax=Nocardiopsis eucommiae TaxID=2831970 RepID=A0A975L7G3_9ACTN|nr:hypothetical protein KGD82_16130 [Nocardiopsis eucommiae]